MTVSFVQFYAFNYFLNVIVSKGNARSGYIVRFSHLVEGTLVFLISEH